MMCRFIVTPGYYDDLLCMYIKAKIELIKSLCKYSPLTILGIYEVKLERTSRKLHSIVGNQLAMYRVRIADPYINVCTYLLRG